MRYFVKLSVRMSVLFRPHINIHQRKLEGCYNRENTYIQMKIIFLYTIEQISIFTLPGVVIYRE